MNTAMTPNYERPLLSVIVAVYKAEKYIERCARSLFGQTLKPMEFIFIDDCSPDGSIGVVKRVLEDYPERKGQVKFMRNARNSGVATTRHNAMEAATGVYVIHCDPDDYILNGGGYSALIDKALATDADVVIMGHALIWSDRRTDKPAILPGDDTASLTNGLLTGALNGYPWDKLIRLDMLREHGINFIEGVNTCEDLLLSVRAFSVSRRIVALKEPIYAYDQYSNPNSLRVIQIAPERKENEKRQLRTWLKHFTESFPDADDSVHCNGVTICAHWHFSRGLCTGGEFRRMFRPYRKAFARSGQSASIKYAVLLSTYPLLHGLLRFAYSKLKG